MRDFITRLSVTDDDAAGALRVIAHFDSLVDGHATRPAFVRAAAALADCPAGIEDRSRGVVQVFAASGRVLPSSGRRTSQVVLEEGAGLSIWLERDGGSGAYDDLILERCAAGIRRTVTQLSSSERVAGDVRLVVDDDADGALRAEAASRLRLGTSLRVVAGLPVGAASPTRTPPLAARLKASAGPVTIALGDVVPQPQWRLGVGSQVSPEELPRSWSEAIVALHHTADGTPAEPGDTTVRFEDLGALACLVPGSICQVPDLAALARAAEQHTWALPTLDALSRHSSLRQAAGELHLHHSTLQERVVTLHRLLGFDPDSPAGRTRTALALAVRRIERTDRLIGPA